MQIHWDGTINFGNVLTAGILFAGFVGAHFQNIRRLDRIEWRVGIVFDWWMKHTGKTPSEMDGPK